MIRRLFFLLSTVCAVIIIVMAFYTAVYKQPSDHARDMMPRSSTASITPLLDSPHLMVSAYMDDRVEGWDVRIIAILRKDAMAPLHCVFRCGGHSSDHSSTPAGFRGDMGFGFPFEAKFVMCRIPATCVHPTHVTLLVHPDGEEERQESFLPIRNRKRGGTEEATEPRVDFTVCISTLFGGYNNVLQYTQALEMYRLLGVDRVVVYNTSCGPDLDRLLHSYSQDQEGFVEVVPWPIDKHLTPSRGWQYLQHGPGDLHYFGQMATLHDCMYRNMESSRYVLLHDIDEIILPYHHDNLTALMSQLQKQDPKAGVFLFRMDLFPTEHVKASRPPQWEGVPGINILEHIDRINTPAVNSGIYKMIVQPRMVEETSVHQVVKHLGNTVVVPPDMARIIHVRSCMKRYTKPPSYDPICKGQRHIDTRLWHFGEKLIASVDKALRRIGMLKTKALRA